MKLRPHQIVAIGQISLGLSILVSTLVMPQYLFSLNQGGISNFGTESSTKILFTFGFGAAASTTLAASFSFASKLKYRYGLVLLSVLYFLVLASTYSYKLSDANESLHHLAALSLFGVMSVYAFLIRFGTTYDKRINVGFFFFYISILISLGTLFMFWNLLFTAQILGGASFGYILVHSIKLIDD